jgi:hypothetical protein
LNGGFNAICFWRAGDLMASAREDKLMDELSRKRLEQVDRFLASLTPEQKALMKAGVRDEKVLQVTPLQKSLAAAIDSPAGMTRRESVEFTKQATLEENHRG